MSEAPIDISPSGILLGGSKSGWAISGDPGGEESPKWCSSSTLSSDGVSAWL